MKATTELENGKAQVPPLADHPSFREIVAKVNECTAREAAARARMSEIEKLLATRAPENPLDVLQGKPPADPDGLRREHALLRQEIDRLRIAARHLGGRAAELAGELGAEVAGPIVLAQFEVAQEISATWRHLRALVEREAKILSALPGGGYSGIGLQSVMPGNVDLEVIVREVNLAVRGLAVRAHPKSLASPLPAGVKPDRDGRVEVRVLSDCRWGKGNDVVRLDVAELNLAIEYGDVDPSPAAVAQARKEQQEARERRERAPAEA